MASFQWTPDHIVELLNSTIILDKSLVIWPHRGPMRPIKMFVAYKLFCNRVFVSGVPPENFTIDIYEKKLLECIGPESDER
ncbi:unnamed protein product [Orchesella dallaii]|uniref:Uncharacterized protein n=1 Tax=Orchesella dallaii TaxID=48710 RepID=A0ABP1QF66_9HEXA